MPEMLSAACKLTDGMWLGRKERSTFIR